VAKNSLIQPIIDWLTQKNASPNLIEKEQSHQSIWRDTGQVYYMLNTLKLSYETQYGPVTFENLNLETLPKLLSDLEASTSKSLKQKETAEQKDAYVISLCGVTWEENENGTRVKAITEAAMLRSTQSDFRRSQAVFKHEQFLEHNDILNAPSLADKKGVFTYSNISIEQFVHQLERANSTISDNLRRRINVQPDNFKKLFSENEAAEIDALLNLDVVGDDLKGLE
jgi:IS30 family transposase